MRVEIFSDVACPFCYIGKRNFEQALNGFDAGPVEVVWRSFQLNPEMPREYDGDMHEYLASKYGVSREEAVAMNDRMLAMADSAGIGMDLERARPRNTFNALRLLHLGVEKGRGNELAEELFAAYFTGSSDIGDPEQLTGLAVAAGIDREAAAEVAGGTRFASEVEKDIAEARELGLTAVPAFIFDRKFLVSGAQPPELLRKALDEAAGAAV